MYVPVREYKSLIGSGGVVNVVVVGPFEEVEKGIGVASDVVKAEGDDPDTPGYLRGDRVRLGRRQSRIVRASPLARSR